MASYSQVTSTALTLNNLILVTPQADTGMQPQDRGYLTEEKPSLPPGLLFNYRGEEMMKLASDITDHYIEDNTVVNDQIALKPEEYTVQGFIGELNDVVPEELLPLKRIADKLTTVAAFTPGLSTSALIAYNTAKQAYDLALTLADSAVSRWESVNNEDAQAPTAFTGSETVTQLSQRINSARNQNKQQVMFQQLYGYWRKRTLFTVQTPWAIFRNMAIKDLQAIQDPDTRMYTDFRITFKVMRFAQTISNVQAVANNQGRAATNIQSAVDRGLAATQEVTTPSKTLAAQLSKLTSKISAITGGA